MAGIEFNICITDEACTYARVASTTAGWYLTPKKWAISSNSGECAPTRTTSSMFTPWIQQPFSGVYSQGANKLLHSVVIPPDGSTYPMNIGEIYFIYQDFYGNEFLYAIAQPTTTLEFTPGVSQSYGFVFALNNTTVADTFIVNYTYPQDIQDHNASPEAHDWLMSRDGSRKAFGIMQYESKLNFSDKRDVVDKEYVDSLVTTIQDLINEVYCPPGTLAWWPSTVLPKNWLVRNGASLKETEHPKLFSVLRYKYGGSSASGKFNLPDDRGLFIRGYDDRSTSMTGTFGTIQNSAAPNITGQIAISNDLNYYKTLFTGAFKHMGTSKDGRCANDRDGATVSIISFDASRCSSNTTVYQNVSEVRPKNRNYLPIIKDDD